MADRPHYPKDKEFFAKHTEPPPPSPYRSRRGPFTEDGSWGGGGTIGLATIDWEGESWTDLAWISVPEFFQSQSSENSGSLLST